jgi:RNA-splicing ligase RtcB
MTATLRCCARISLLKREADRLFGSFADLGSRNIGKGLAECHIATAKTLEHNIGLPDRDLAVFLADTEEMTAYLHDLYWLRTTRGLTEPR